MDDSDGTVTRWLDDYQAGDRDAARPLVERYFARLVGLARVKLRGTGAGSAAYDEEDVAQTVLRGLCNGIERGRFPDLMDRDDLWRVLAHLTACKVRDRRRRERRLKRGAGRERPEADLAPPGGDDDVAAPNLAEVVGREPSPELAAELAEQFRARLDSLGDPELRRIATLKLEGHTNEEIRQDLGCSLRKVTLRLELIRKLWREAEAR